MNELQKAINELEELIPMAETPEMKKTRLALITKLNEWHIEAIDYLKKPAFNEKKETNSNSLVAIGDNNTQNIITK